MINRSYHYRTHHPILHPRTLAARKFKHEKSGVLTDHLHLDYLYVIGFTFASILAGLVVSAMLTFDAHEPKFTLSTFLVFLLVTFILLGILVIILFLLKQGLLHISTKEISNLNEGDRQVLNHTLIRDDEILHIKINRPRKRKTQLRSQTRFKSQTWSDNSR